MVKDCIEYLLKNKIGPKEGEKLIRESQKLSDDEKLLIYSYCYPRKIGDYELPKFIINYRKSAGANLKGTLGRDHREACILVEAYRGLQYSRFIRHLMHAFLKPELLNSVEGEGEEKCPVCGKPIYYVGSQDKVMDPEDETLAFMSSESSVCMCKDCLIQLAYCYELISSIEGPDFLTKWGNSAGKTSNP